MTVASEVGDDQHMRSVRRRFVTISLACLLVVPGMFGVIAAGAGDTAAPRDVLRVFDLPVSGPDPFRRFGPLANSEAVDMAALPSGDIVVLLERGSPATECRFARRMKVKSSGRVGLLWESVGGCG